MFIDGDKQILIYERGGLVFAMNFNPSQSFDGYYMAVPQEGDYRVLLSSDSTQFGGWDRISEKQVYHASIHPDGKPKLQIYLPARTGLCLGKIKKTRRTPKA